jgi:hypothetical protein
MRQLVRWAGFICAARTEVTFEKLKSNWTPIAAKQPEAPWKVVNYLKELAMGNALIDERREINEADLAFVAHVAISSIPGHLRPLIRALQAKETVRTGEASESCRRSAPTARNYLRELELLGIVNLTAGEPKTNTSYTARLATHYRWLNPKLGR